MGPHCCHGWSDRDEIGEQYGRRHNEGQQHYGRRNAGNHPELLSETVDTFTPPQELDALRTLEEHLSQGWAHPVDVLVDATIEETSRWVPRSLGRLEPDEESRTRLRATTDEPDWYARQLAAIPAPFRVIGSRELRRATAALGQRLAQAGGGDQVPI